MLIRQSRCNFNASGLNYASEITLANIIDLLCTVYTARATYGWKGVALNPAYLNLCSINVKLTHNPEITN